MSKVSNKIGNWIPAVLVALLIFSLSSLAGETVQQTGLGQNKYQINAHFFLYFLLFISVYKATKHYRNAGILSFLYSISDELHQTFVPGRAFQIFDIFVDSAGIMLAAIILWKLKSHLPKILMNWLKK